MRQKFNCKKRLSRLVIALSVVLGIGSFSMQAFALPRVEISQPNKIVKGHVVDENGEALPGASVVVKGQTSGVISDINGNFSLSVASGNVVIVVSSVGYKTQEIALNGRTTVNISMSAAVSELKEVVVTALGIKREKKSLGYAVQDVKADELNKVGSTTLTDALQGKVAGLKISDSSTGAGGSSKVVLRGNSSLVGNDSPLWVVDGVPYDTGIDTNNMQWGGMDRAGGAFDLNPEDIESVSVLKGPTAAALYGSRAGNGVIMVTTKKGGKNGQLGVTYSGKFTVSKVAYTLDEQDVYGQGTNGVFSSESDLSWGAKMTGQSVAAWWDKTKTTSYLAQEDVMKDFYRDGGVQSNSVSFQGGDKDNPFRITLSNDYTKGNVKYNSVTKTGFDFVGSFKMNKFMTFDLKADYTNTKGLNRQELGSYSTAFYLYATPRNIQLKDLNNYKFNPDLAALGDYEHFNWYGPDATHQNPYFIMEQWKNKDVKNRLFGYAALNIAITPDLKLKVKQGMDIADTQYRYIYPYNDPVFTANYPESEMSKYTSKEMNSEFLLSYNKTFGDFQVGVSAGGNRMYKKTEGLWGKSGKMPVYGAHFLSLGSAQAVTNSLYEKEINSLYAFANLGYKDFLFMDLTARNDWSSTLPSANRSYFYPSVSLSGIVTSFMDAMNISYNKKLINYGKIRFSIAQVGKDTEPYQLLDTYGTTTDDAFGYFYTTEPTTMANPNLKPEIATSYEIGTEWRLFNNRFGFDITYYNTGTKNQVVPIDLVQTSGWAKKYLNIGKISNKGIEVALNGSVIRTRNFNLDLTANFAHNRTELVRLSPEANHFTFDELNGSGGTMSLRAYPGQKFGTIYDYGYKRDNKGNAIVDNNGLPIKTSDQIKLGDIQPDFTGSFGFNLGYKGLFLSALFNFQKGGDIYSFTENLAAKYGVAKRTGNREDFVFKGVTESGAVNTKKISAQSFWTNAPAEEFMYDASFLKLKELSLGYVVPKSFLSKYTNNLVSNLKLSVFGSNLLYLVKHTPGTTPDNSAFSATVFAQAVDYAPLPNTRTFGISVNVGF
jgi:TonB-linked outer membrane protein, SusC/RagA family